MADLNLVSFDPKETDENRIRPPKTTSVPVTYHTGGAPIIKKPTVTATLNRSQSISSNTALLNQVRRGHSFLIGLDPDPGSQFSTGGGSLTLNAAFFSPRIWMLRIPPVDVTSPGLTRQWTTPTAAEIISFLRDQGDCVTAGTGWHIPVQTRFGTDGDILTFVEGTNVTLETNSPQSFGIDSGSFYHKPIGCISVMIRNSNPGAERVSVVIS